MAEKTKGKGGYGPGMFFPSQVDYGQEPSDVTAGQFASDVELIRGQIRASQQQDDFSDVSGADILSEIGEGGGCQKAQHVPVFINGVPSGCASITYFDDYFDPGIAGGGPTIQIPSFESVYGELPEGTVTWQIGDFNGDGVREVYTIDADGNPHTVYGYDDSGNVTSSPYEEGTTEATGLEEYYEVFGEGLVNDVIDKLGDFIDKAEDAVDDPLGAVKNILDNVLPAAKDCESWTDPCTSGGNPCWKDCVEVGLIFGIPGLPMPPGMVGATVRDIENAVKEAGQTIGDFIEDPVGTINEIITETKKKIQGVFSSGSDPQGIYDWIKGILGNVIGGVVWNEIGDTIDELFVGGDDDGPQTPIDCTKLDEFNANKDYCLDQGFVNCDELTSQTGKQLTGGIKQGQENCEEIQDPQCIGDGIWNGEKCVCPEGTDKVGEDEPLNGDCSDGDTKTLEEEICENKGLTYDPSAPEADRDEDDCVSGTTDGDDITTTETDIVCEEGVAINPSNTYSQRKTDWDSACGQTHCFQGVGQAATKMTDHVDNNCSNPLKTDVDDGDDGGTDETDCSTITDSNFAACGKKKCDEKPGAVFTYVDVEEECQYRGGGIDTVTKCDDGSDPDPNTGCREDWCDDARTIPKVPGEDCPVDVVDCSQITDENAKQCGKEKCADGTFKDKGTCPDITECPNGQQLVNGECVTIYTCDDPNATTRPDGSCGPCKTGYVFDGAVERCVQESVTDPCDDPAYAAANPTECGSLPPECTDCSCAEYAAANPDECGTGGGGDDGGGDDGGGGGGGVGMFRPQASAPPSLGDPQLLARTEFPIVDYLSESLAQQTKGELMQGMLTGNIV